MDHSAEGGQHAGEEQWGARAEQLEREAEVLLPYVDEVASWVAELCRQDGVEVRRVLDVGSGPGVIACELARCFPLAAVVAVDASPALLEKAAARAAAAGLSGRVTTYRADLPDDLDGLGQADLIWAAMVLHHIGDEIAALHTLRGLLDPGGMLVVVEHGDPWRLLPDDIQVGRPGLVERLATMDAAPLAARGGGHGHADHSAAWPTMLDAAGFELVGERVVHVRLTAPLSTDARRVARAYAQRLRHLLGERSDDGDRRALDTLIDEENPLGIMRRDDVFLDASRHVYVARAAVARDR